MKRFVTATVLAMIGSIGLGAPPAVAAPPESTAPAIMDPANDSPKTLYVDGETGEDTTTYGCSDANPCKTIQYAIDQAASDDTVAVAAGTYNEGLTIDKSLTLLGAKSGLNPNDNTDPWKLAAEWLTDVTIIQPPSAESQHAIKVSRGPGKLSVSIDGFLVDMKGTQRGQRYIDASSGSSDEGLRLNVSHNYFRNAKYSVNGNWYLTGNKRLDLVIDENRFKDAEVSNGIAVWSNTDGDYSIAGNVWLDNGYTALNLNSPIDRSSGTVAVTSNWIGNSSPIDDSNSSTSRQAGFIIAGPGPYRSGDEVSGNTFRFIESASVYFWDTFSGTLAVRNNLIDGYKRTGQSAAGIAMSSSASGAQVGGVTAEFNSFVNSEFGTAAVFNRNDSGPLNVTLNWWGQGTGPDDTQIVGANVTSSPWIVSYTNDPAKAGEPGFWPIITESEAVVETPTNGDDSVTQDFESADGTASLAITFERVTGSGQTTVQSFTDSFPTPPSGFTLGSAPVYFTIQTSATVSGPIELCFNFNPADFTTDPTVYHFTNGNWVALETTVTGSTACGTVTSFSPFALGVPIQPTPPAPTFPPSAPLAVTGTPGDGQVTVSWQAPASSGSFPITTYQAEALPSGGSCLVSAPALTCTITGLTNGNTYTLRARALNGAGWSSWSAESAPVTPGTGVPGAPSNVNAVAGNGDAVVTWTAPEGTGSSPITGYRIEQSRADGEWTVALADTGSTDTVATVSSLVNGDPYRFRVAAINASGVGPVSPPSPSVTPEDPETVTIVITGERAKVRKRPGIRINGESTGLDEVTILRPWYRFPGQTEFTQGRTQIRVAGDGTFTWQRRTGKKITVYVEAPDGVRSNRIVIRR